MTQTLDFFHFFKKICLQLSNPKSLWYTCLRIRNLKLKTMEDTLDV